MYIFHLFFQNHILFESSGIPGFLSQTAVKVRRSDTVTIFNSI